MVRKSRNTRQKEILLDEIGKFNSFFTAEDLLSKANKKDSKLGIATVYRFLNELSKSGHLHPYICGKRSVYSAGKKSHCHFTCEKCRKVEHIEIKSLDFIRSKIHKDVCSFQIDITGICEKCR